MRHPTEHGADSMQINAIAKYLRRKTLSVSITWRVFFCVTLLTVLPVRSSDAGNADSYRIRLHRPIKKGLEYRVIAVGTRKRSSVSMMGGKALKQDTFEYSVE